MTLTSTTPSATAPAVQPGRAARLASLAVTGALLLSGTTGVVAATLEQLLRLH